MLNVAHSLDVHRFKKIGLIFLNLIGIYEGSSYPFGDNIFRHGDDVRHLVKRQKVKRGLKRKENAQEGNKLSTGTFLRSSLEDIIPQVKNHTELSDDLYDNLLILSPCLDQQFPSVYKTFIDEQRRGNALAYFAYLLDSIFLAFAGTAQLIHRNNTNYFNDAR